ncbi:MAG: hypothetical protein V1701_06355 [Planctomycetota bacterium]
MIVPIIAYSSPIVIGLIIPLLLTERKKHLAEFLVKVLILTGITSLVVGIAALLARDTFYYLTIQSYVFFVIFLASWSVLVSGLYFFLAHLNNIRIPAMIITYAVIIFLYGLVFFANPLIETFSYSLYARQFVIKIIVFINPFLTIAANFFRDDILRAGTIYKQSIIGAYYSYSYADWRVCSFVYCVIGVVCYSIGYYQSRKTDIKT